MQNSQVVTTSMIARNQIIGSAQPAKHKSDIARFGSTPRKPIFVNIVFEHQGKFPVSRPIPAKYLQPQTVSRPWTWTIRILLNTDFGAIIEQQDWNFLPTSLLFPLCIPFLSLACGIGERRACSMASASTNPLFGGGLGASTQASAPFPPNNPTSIFGNTSTMQAPAHGSLFGSQSQNQQPPAQSSAVGQSQVQTNMPPSSQFSGQATQPAFFNSLLERGKKRPLSALGQTSSFEQLPSLQLGLDDIRRKARELGTGGSKDSQLQAPSSKA